MSNTSIEKCTKNRAQGKALFWIGLKLNKSESNAAGAFLKRSNEITQEAVSSHTRSLPAL